MRLLGYRIVTIEFKTVFDLSNHLFFVTIFSFRPFEPILETASQILIFREGALVLNNKNNSSVQHSIVMEQFNDKIILTVHPSEYGRVNGQLGPYLSVISDTNVETCKIPDKMLGNCKFLVKKQAFSEFCWANVYSKVCELRS